MTTEKEVLIIGAGQVGTALYRLLRERLQKDVLLADIKPLSEIVTDYPFQSNYIQISAVNQPIPRSINFIAVPDDLITKVMESFTASQKSDKIFIHTNGAQPAQILKTEANSSYRVGSFHPLQTFSGLFSSPDIWDDIIGTYQGDEEGYERVKELLKPAKIKLISVTAKQKTAIHTAAALISNLFFALAQGAGEILQQADFSMDARELLLPLVKQTVENYGNKNIAEAITGPLKRGDAETVRMHLKYLDRHRDVKEIYQTLSLYLLKHPDIMERSVQKIRKLLDDAKA